MLQGRQIMSMIFSSSESTRFQEDTMKLTDLLLVELEYDNLKLFNQSCEEALFAIGDDLDGFVLETLYERLKDREAAVVSAKRGVGQDSRSWTSKGSCPGVGQMFSRVTLHEERERQGAKIKKSRSKEQFTRKSKRQNVGKRPLWQRRSPSVLQQQKGKLYSW